MARYYNKLSAVMPITTIETNLTDYLTQNGFKKKVKKGEEFWQKGNGWVAAPQYIKVSYELNEVSVEAWIRSALLPGVYGKEMDLDGAMGFAIKASLKKKVEKIENIIQGKG